MIYLLVAYRYGWTDVDVFELGRTPNRIEALTIAEQYVERRGGKYAVRIELVGSGEIIKYFPSSYGEKEPRPLIESLYAEKLKREEK